MNKFANLILILAALTLPACTWVKLTPEGQQVEPAIAKAVQRCEKLGNVNVSLKHEIARVERKAEKVSRELQILARNEAALMGGNTIVPQSAVTEGRQEFGVFNCP